MKIYVASSWRNTLQPGIVDRLRAEGHTVYDFRNPAPGDNGFGWREISPGWETWTPAEFRDALEHPIAARGFGYDMKALEDCDACVLVLPCGRSAHLELGHAVGSGKPTLVLLAEGQEPELMYRMCTGLCLTIDEVVVELAKLEAPLCGGLPDRSYNRSFRLALGPCQLAPGHAGAHVDHNGMRFVLANPGTVQAP